jgi:hypothetical protein
MTKARQKTKRYARVTLADARADFAHRGLTLLADEYVNVSTRMLFRCRKCGYKGTLPLNDVRRKGCGCRMCGIRRRVAGRTFSLQQVESLLKREKIKLLSKVYENSSSMLQVECMKCGNVWKATFNSLNPNKKRHTGCPPCSLARAVDGRRHTTEQVRSLLQKMGITLLSEYEQSQKPIKVRFGSCGHITSKSWNELQSGRGCSRCAKNARVLDEDYEAIAVQFGGRLLRKADQANKDSDWECALSHVFHRSFTSIKMLQTFCTKCSSSYAEMLCRAMAETLFGVTFRCIRIKDMRSVKGRPLELDIFNEELRLAIEHNGAHHYEAQHNWGGDKALGLQRENDKRRRVYCSENGILLIEIRELGKKTSVEQAREQIREALVRAKRKIPPHFDKVDLRLLKPKTETEAYWQSVKDAAAQMGLTILPCVYESADKHVPVECSKGHKTMKTPRSILQGHKCDECNSLRMSKAVRLSDGREFESGTEAAKALGVTKETVNRAAVAGWRVKGLYVERIDSRSFPARSAKI